MEQLFPPQSAGCDAISASVGPTNWLGKTVQEVVEWWLHCWNEYLIFMVIRMIPVFLQFEDTEEESVTV